MTLTDDQFYSIHMTEREVPIIIDALQRIGWDVVQGIAVRFCSDDEERAFWKDFEKVIMVLVFAKVHWGIVP